MVHKNHTKRVIYCKKSLKTGALLENLAQIEQHFIAKLILPHFRTLYIVYYIRNRSTDIKLKNGLRSTFQIGLQSIKNGLRSTFTVLLDKLDQILYNMPN